MQQMLEKEIEQLRLEKGSLEKYIERTDLWCDYIGKWRTDICSAQVSLCCISQKVFGALPTELSNHIRSPKLSISLFVRLFTQESDTKL